jgi:hypothetical protein
MSDVLNELDLDARNALATIQSDLEAKIDSLTAEVSMLREQN